MLQGLMQTWVKGCTEDCYAQKEVGVDENVQMINIAQYASLQKLRKSWLFS